MPREPEPDELRDVVAERRYSLVVDGAPPSEVTVRFGRPEPDPEPGGDWRCAVEIRGLGAPSDGVSFGYGVDGVQAMQLAMQMAGLRLRYRADAATARLTWLDGDEELGMPLPDGSAAIPDFDTDDVDDDSRA